MDAVRWDDCSSLYRSMLDIDENRRLCSDGMAEGLSSPMVHDLVLASNRPLSATCLSGLTRKVSTLSLRRSWTTLFRLDLQRSRRTTVLSLFLSVEMILNPPHSQILPVFHIFHCRHNDCRSGDLCVVCGQRMICLRMTVATCCPVEQSVAF